jgi:hypothetical protein
VSEETTMTAPRTPITPNDATSAWSGPVTPDNAMAALATLGLDVRNGVSICIQLIKSESGRARFDVHFQAKDGRRIRLECADSADWFMREGDTLELMHCVPATINVGLT